MVWIVLLVLALGVGAAGVVTAWRGDWWESPAVSLEPILPPSMEGIDGNLVGLINRHADKVRQAPSDAERHAVLGMVYEANEMWTEAQACFETAARLDPSDPVYAYHMGLMMESRANYTGALEHMRALVEAHPDYAPAQYWLGRALLREGELDQARRAFERAIALRSDLPAGYVGLADVALRRQQPEQALQLLDKSLAMSPGLKRAHFLRGTALQRLGRREEAQRALARGLGGDASGVPDRLSALSGRFVTGLAVQLGRGADLIDRGNYQEAARVLEAALEQRPGDVNVLNNLSVAYQKMRAYDDAMDVLMRAKRSDPTAFPTYINLTECAIYMGRAAEAVGYAEKAVELAPEVGQAQFALGRALVAAGRLEEAYDALRQTMRLDTRNPEVFLMMGEVCARLNRFAEARGHFQEAARRLPDRLPVHVNIFHLSVELGDLQTAEQALAKARRLAPDHPRVLAAERKLQALRSP